MKTTDFTKPVTSHKLNENMFKNFGVKVNLDKYSREQLEDYRNLLRTKLHQYESKSNFNDLLTNETYQKDKHLVGILNARIKEMLGESIKVLELSLKESKAKEGNAFSKAVVDAKRDGIQKGEKVKVGGKTYPVKEASKPDFLDMDKDGDKKEPMKKATKDKKAGPKKGVNPFAKVKEGFPTVDDAKKAAAGTANMKPGEKKKSSTGGEITKTATGLKHTAGKNYGGEDAPKTPDSDKKAKKTKESVSKLAEANARFKHNVKFVNESLGFLLNEDEEGKAKAITAAGDMVNDYTSWMQRVGQYQTKTMIELADAIKADFGAAEAEAFKQAVGPALSATLEVLTQQREAVSNAVAVLAGEAAPEEPMGMEPSMNMPPEPSMDMSAPDEMNPAGDEFAGADAAAGGATDTGREMRESQFSRKLAESHSIISRLAK